MVFYVFSSPLKVHLQVREYNMNICLDPRQTLSSEPYREYRTHEFQKDIFDISWGTSSASSNLVLSASQDFTVCVYNIG